MNSAKIILCALASLSSSQDTRSFPQSDQPLRNKSATLELFIVSDENKDIAHTLYFRNLRTSKTTEILSFGRSIDVSWSKEGSEFFVNDNFGSNGAICRVAQIDEKDSIRWLKLKASPNRDCESSDATDHCYLTCTAWSGSGKIAGMFDYYGDKGTVREHITFQIED